MIEIFTRTLNKLFSPTDSPTLRLRTTGLLLAGSVAIFFTACMTAASQENLAEKRSGQIRIIYSGNTLGELKPCGCAREEDQGGFERRMGYLKLVRAGSEDILLLDTGDNFKEPTRQGQVKAKYLMQAMKEMEYDAVLPGDHDFVYGNSFLREQNGIPWILSNVDVDMFAKVRIKHFGNGLRAAIIAVADPDLLYGSRHARDKIISPEKAIEEQLRRLAGETPPDLVVLLTHMKREKALAFLDMEGVDVIVNGHIVKDTDLIDMKPVLKNGKVFVQPGPRGQKMGELTVTIGPRGEKSFAQKMVPLGSKIALDPGMVTLYEEYNKEVEDMFFASLSKRKGKKKNVFATEKSCKTCHPEIHQIWEQSRHGHAYKTLRKINKAFDPECLVCHVVGWNEPGGFVSEIDTPDLMNVQCEVCHGPALQHAGAPTQKFAQDAKQACKKCHVKNHSPGFNFDKYWDTIKH
ncbi:5'-nucleotidase [hydrothermal vent metagenome]|uniref:5'-nucleotidase n=1 Tax=hydrothermal vent metagenome TaxID=652676 RepID=A0A3B1DGQ7_9ZZZZ